MLITRCPNCATTFRVRMEQLNLRGGRVRCGHCHIPFSALASLEELPEETATSQRVSPAPSAQPTPASAEIPQAAATAAMEARSPQETPTAESPAIDAQPEATGDEFIAPISLPPTPPALHRAESATHPATQVMPLDEGGELDFDIEGLHGASGEENQPANASSVVIGQHEEPLEEADRQVIELGATDDDAEAFDREFEKNLGLDEEEDDTLIPEGDQGDDADGMPQLHTVFLDEDIPHGAAADPAALAARARTKRTLILGNLLLLLTGTLLSAYVLRVELTRLYPNLRAPLEQACALFSCEVPYPRDADEVLLVGSDLTQATTPIGAYHLAVTVRNHARYPVAWPQLEITLTDRFERALTRRVLEPKEWLPTNLADRPAFEAQGELTSQITLSSDSQVMGYRLGVFYR